MRDLLFEVGSKQRIVFASKLVFAGQARKTNRLFSEWVWPLSDKHPDLFLASRDLREFRTINVDGSFFDFIATIV